MALFPKILLGTMAKKINTEETSHAEAYEPTPVERTDTSETVPAETGQSGTAVTAQQEKPAGKNHEGTQAADSRVLGLLKKFPAYASLYIDAHGGTFTPDTPPAIRGKAELYKNPYYNELKTKV